MRPSRTCRACASCLTVVAEKSAFVLGHTSELWGRLHDLFSDFERLCALWWEKNWSVHFVAFGVGRLLPPGVQTPADAAEAAREPALTSAPTFLMTCTVECVLWLIVWRAPAILAACRWWRCTAAAILEEVKPRGKLLGAAEACNMHV